MVQYVKTLVKSTKLARTLNSKEIVARVVEKFKRKVSRATLFRIFSRHSMYFAPPPKNNIFKKTTIEERFAFATKYRNKGVDFWMKVDAYLDNKRFAVYNTEQSKYISCRKSLRGYYRQKGDAYTYELSKPNPKMKNSGGSQSVEMSLAFNSDGVVMTRMFNKKWNGHQACLMYKCLAQSLYDSGRKQPGDEILIVEDGDPSGYESGKAKAIKRQLNIRVLKLPPYSPCLNPLDFSVFAEVESLMTVSNRELLIRKMGKETRQSYLNRLRRKTRSLKTSYLRKTIGSLPKRLNKLYVLKGNIWRD